jgi:hypothetical protein
MEPLKFRARLPLYARVGFGLVVLFALLGNCTRPTSPAPVVIAAMVSVLWVCTRIVQEAIEAWHILVLAKAHNAELEKSKDVKPPSP